MKERRKLIAQGAEAKSTNFYINYKVITNDTFK